MRTCSIVSTLIPRGVDRTTNVVEFYYPEDIALFEREFVEAEQAAYMETAAEDDEIAERMDAGRRALYRAGRNEVGPYQSPMEDGMQHFHEFLRRELGRISKPQRRRTSGDAQRLPPAPSTLHSTHSAIRAARMPGGADFEVRCSTHARRIASMLSAPPRRWSRADDPVREVPAAERPRSDPVAGPHACRWSRSTSGTTSARRTKSRAAPASRICSST